MMNFKNIFNSPGKWLINWQNKHNVKRGRNEVNNDVAKKMALFFSVGCWGLLGLLICLFIQFII